MIRRGLTHAVMVTLGAHMAAEGAAGPTRERLLHNQRVRAKRKEPKLFDCWPEQRDDRSADSRRQMHEPRVVTDHRPRSRQQAADIGKCRADHDRVISRDTPASICLVSGTANRDLPARRF